MNKQSKQTIALSLGLGLGLASLIACGVTPQPLGSKRPSGIVSEETVGNSPPVIQALTTSALSLNKDGTATLRVQAYDGEGDPLTYRWSSTRGTLQQSSGSEVSWVPVKNNQPEKGIGILMVEVSDGKYTTPGALNVLIKADGSTQLQLDPQAANLICRKDPAPGKAVDALTNDDRKIPIKLDSTNLPTLSVTLDGKPDEWGNILPVVQDDARDTGTADAARDIKALYLARDSRHLYYRIDTWGKPDPAKAQDYRISMGWTGNIEKDGTPETTGLEVGQVVEGKVPIVELTSLDKLFVTGVIRSGSQFADRTRQLKLLSKPEPVPVATPTPAASSGGATTPVVAKQILNNFVLPDATGAYTDPPCQPSFTISQPHRIAGVVAYHSRSSTGPVNLSLKSSSGQTYGPWSATGSTVTASSGTRNWSAFPSGVVIPAGTYNVLDSENTTWIASGGPSGCGMTIVNAVPQ